jgi:hypothetical protein
MKVESIKCLSVKAEGENLFLVLSETSFEEIEQTLVGKSLLSVFADNGEGDVLVEKHYEYGKADSCDFDFDKKTFTLRLRKLSTLEKKVMELEALMKGKFEIEAV